VCVRTKLSASELRSRALQLGKLNWREYLTGFLSLWWAIIECERSAAKGHTTILVRESVPLGMSDIHSTWWSSLSLKLNASAGSNLQLMKRT
jgi:hypothetical protein